MNLLHLMVAFGIQAFAGQPPPQEGCFDLSRPNQALLRPAPSHYSEAGKEIEAFGLDEATKFAWAKLDGIVEKPLAQILTRLLDPMTTRDPDITKLSVSEIKVPGALHKDLIHVKVKPIFFLTLEWEEEWLYTVKEGKPEAPKSVVIAYQKINGTSHIEHFCGTILLERISDRRTGIYLVEEIKADRRSPKDVYQGLLGTLRTLRE
jgi:hypothetical protein